MLLLLLSLLSLIILWLSSVLFYIIITIIIIIMLLLFFFIIIIIIILTIERGDHDFYLSLSHFTDTDPTKRKGGGQSRNGNRDGTLYRLSHRAR